MEHCGKYTTANKDIGAHHGDMTATFMPAMDVNLLDCNSYISLGSGEQKGDRCTDGIVLPMQRKELPAPCSLTVSVFIQYRNGKRSRGPDSHWH